MGDDRQADLIVDGHRAFAPGFGMGEIIFPGVKAFFLISPAGI
jgi:hypothetical protein